MLKSISKILCTLMILPTLSYADYTVNPVKIKIPEGSMMGSTELHNHSNEPRKFQVRIFATNADKSNTSTTETTDLIVSPPLFNVQGGDKKQIIRVAVKNADAAFKQKYYVASIKEFDRKVDAEGSVVKVLTEFMVPITLGNDSASEAVKH